MLTGFKPSNHFLPPLWALCFCQLISDSRTSKLCGVKSSWLLSFPFPLLILAVWRLPLHQCLREAWCIPLFGQSADVWGTSTNRKQKKRPRSFRYQNVLAWGPVSQWIAYKHAWIKKKNVIVVKVKVAGEYAAKPEIYSILKSFFFLQWSIKQNTRI